MDKLDKAYFDQIRAYIDREEALRFGTIKEIVGDVLRKYDIDSDYATELAEAIVEELDKNGVLQ